ncbi:MAG TPA: type II toxin-antitoxin system VapB family antitoxin [Pseudolabrys sp.]|nr:type II toxin-antitoxin system VapB family antitoxin [Pseudolabrys sp.]
MGLNIKNHETEKLIRELAQLRGQGITEVLTDVIGREVERERKKPKRETYEAFSRRIEAIVEQVKQLPVLDDRSPDEILGYNEHGHFD